MNKFTHNDALECLIDLDRLTNAELRDKEYVLQRLDIHAEHHDVTLSDAELEELAAHVVAAATANPDLTA